MAAKPHIYLILLTCVLLTACGYDDFGDYRPGESTAPVPNMDIGDVKALYDGKPLNVRDDIIIAGYVSANDRSGNFHRTFVIEDHTGAIEVRAGTYNLFNTFALGRYVAIKAKGLTVGSYDGVLQIGLAPPEPGGYQTDYFGYRAVMDSYVFPGGVFMEVTPVSPGIAGLDEKYCGRLVKINGLAFVPGEDEAEEGVTWAVPRSDGVTPKTKYRIFCDDEGGQVAVVTSGYADFAGEPLPVSKADITGVLMRGRTDTGKTMFILKMRDTGDVYAY